MKRSILFKTLVDILFMAQVVGFIGVIFFIPSGVLRINMIDLPVSEWTFVFWLILLLSLIGYIVFVMGLFHLRKVARHLLSNRYFDVTVVEHLKYSGRYFVISGMVSFVISLIIWVIKITMKTLALYDSDIITSLFIITIGLFFIIQSEVIMNAKTFKEDSDLTI
jgi:hypothetical protein